MNFMRQKKIDEYKDALKRKNDEELFKEAENKIWLSAYAHNNPRSDYHWQVDAIYDECTFEAAKKSAQ